MSSCGVKINLFFRYHGFASYNKRPPHYFFLFKKPVHTALRNCFDRVFIEEEILPVKA